jgi:RNA polymerase sigma-70 factor (ECF subfamily)
MLRHEKVRLRYEKLFLRNASESISESEFSYTDSKELQADINKAVSELPEQMRTIFELSRYEGLKYAEIARQLDISIKTVETQMSRALAKLRQKLSNYLTLCLWIPVIAAAINNFFCQL